jgi:hypothetical protein|tara:strand:+ start:2473 stop:2856 length:384 start_codon:yes stop_codon:yes gene_type:complete
MGVVNQYKMYGVTSTSAEGPIKFFGTTLVPPVTGAATQNPLINETYIIKSLHVTNKSASNTPTITITNNGFQVINTQTLSTSASVEILSNPMIVEGNTVLSYTTAGTVSDGVDITISYLNIQKERID